MASVSPRAAFRILNVLAIVTMVGGVWLLARGGDRDPRLIVSPATLELAPRSDGSESRGVFQIVNAGGRAVELGPASTTCVCTVAEIEPQTIPPGGAATVTVQAKPVGVGRTRVSITIPTDANPAELSLNVVVVGRAEPPYVAIAIEAIRFGEVGEPGETVPLYVETREFANRPPWLLDPASTVSGVEIEGGPVTEGDLNDGLCWRRYEYTARLIDLPSPGEFQGELRFAGHGAGATPVLRIPIHGIRMDAVKEPQGFTPE